MKWIISWIFTNKKPDISLLIISIFILSLMFFGVCLILNYKFSILKSNIIYSIRFLKKAFEKNSKCSYKDYSIELTYYTKELQTGEKVYESSEPFIWKKNLVMKFKIKTCTATNSTLSKVDRFKSTMIHH